MAGVRDRAAPEPHPSARRHRSAVRLHVPVRVVTVAGLLAVARDAFVVCPCGEQFRAETSQRLTLPHGFDAYAVVQIVVEHDLDTAAARRFGWCSLLPLIVE